MKRARQIDLAVYGVCALVGLIVSFAVKGTNGLIGMSLGLVGSCLNFYALWLLVRLIGSVANENPMPKLGSSLTVLGFLVKLPVFIALGLYARTLPGAINCFLAGLVLVHFCVVRWASLDS